MWYVVQYYKNMTNSCPPPHVGNQYVYYVVHIQNKNLCSNSVFFLDVHTTYLTKPPIPIFFILLKPTTYIYTHILHGMSMVK